VNRLAKEWGMEIAREKPADHGAFCDECVAAHRLEWFTKPVRFGFVVARNLDPDLGLIQEYSQQGATTRSPRRFAASAAVPDPRH
jgi:hypothetical protein